MINSTRRLKASLVLTPLLILLNYALTITTNLTPHPIANPLIANANAQSIERNNSSSGKHSYPGGIAALSMPKQSAVFPTIKYGLYEPVIIDSGAEWKILIGLDLDTVPGEYLLYVKDNASEAPAYNMVFTVDNNSILFIEELHADYGEFKLDSLSDVDFQNSEQPKLPFIEPTTGTWSDLFGAVVLNQNPNRKSTAPKRQDYVSLAAAEFSPVTAPSNAIVSRITLSDSPTNEPQLATVYLDHGRGLFSIISGISDLSVETGNGVVAGAVIGKLPPSDKQFSELVWRCVLNGVLVNPLILTELK